MFAKDETSTAPPHEAQLSRAIKNNPNSIIVVDDDAQICALFEITLRMQGFAVITANSGQKALELLDSVNPDLFIIDMAMPDMNGLDLCQMIRALPSTSKTPILMVSARYESRMIPLVKAAGANDFIWKLTPQITLMRRIRQLLDQKSDTSTH